MEQGWDPEVKKFFVKIINTISIGLFWLLSAATAGIYFKMGYRTDKPWIMLIYYVLLLVTLYYLIRHLYRLWKNG